MLVTILTSWFFEHSQWSIYFGWYLFLCFLLINYLPPTLYFKILYICGFWMSFTVRNVLNDSHCLANNRILSQGVLLFFLLKIHTRIWSVALIYMRDFWNSLLKIVCIFYGDFPLCLILSLQAETGWAASEIKWTWRKSFQIYSVHSNSLGRTAFTWIKNLKLKENTQRNLLKH